jgi:hypothetical protein
MLKFEGGPRNGWRDARLGGRSIIIASWDEEAGKYETDLGSRPMTHDYRDRTRAWGHDIAYTLGDPLYRVERHYSDEKHEKHRKVIWRGATLEQAKAHCDTHRELAEDGSVIWADRYFEEKARPLRAHGWGHGLQPGDYLLLSNEGGETRYVVRDDLRYEDNPPDMWFATLKYAPRPWEGHKVIS